MITTLKKRKMVWSASQGTRMSRKTLQLLHLVKEVIVESNVKTKTFAHFTLIKLWQTLSVTQANCCFTNTQSRQEAADHRFYCSMRRQRKKNTRWLGCMWESLEQKVLEYFCVVQVALTNLNNSFERIKIIRKWISPHGVSRSTNLRTLNKWQRQEKFALILDWNVSHHLKINSMKSKQLYRTASFSHFWEQLVWLMPQMKFSPSSLKTHTEPQTCNVLT